MIGLNAVANTVLTPPTMPRTVTFSGRVDLGDLRRQQNGADARVHGEHGGVGEQQEQHQAALTWLVRRFRQLRVDAFISGHWYHRAVRARGPRSGDEAGHGYSSGGELRAELRW
ncbi:hypothetical protein ACFZCP_07365 [Streptomyces sp. NPDC007971]|uniref:hypothetical protein n=1 Tax=Streptomyces sp. NPDC007971 TaxID=3364799 RepID=UPI0036EF586C